MDEYVITKKRYPAKMGILDGNLPYRALDGRFMASIVFSSTQLWDFY